MHVRVDSYRSGVKKDSKTNDVKELIEFEEANPVKVTVGISGKVSGRHLAALQFMKLTDTKPTLVT